MSKTTDSAVGGTETFSAELRAISSAPDRLIVMTRSDRSVGRAARKRFDENRARSPESACPTKGATLHSAPNCLRRARWDSQSLPVRSSNCHWTSGP